MAQEDERDKDGAPDKLTTYPPVELIRWVQEQAARHKRTVSKELEVMIEEARQQRERKAS